MALLRSPLFLPTLVYRMYLISAARVSRPFNIICRSASTATSRAQRDSGDISSIFTSIGSRAQPSELPQRFVDLKKDIWTDALVQSWREVLAELESATGEVIEQGAKIIPQLSYSEIKRGLNSDSVAEIRKVGSVIIKGAVPKEEALDWKQSIRDYIALNPGKVKGFPQHDIQVYEFYNSKAQIRARGHPDIINTQRALLSLWHSSDPATEVDLNTPISYFDRLRIRNPGDNVFTLGPHIDGGGVERHEDPGFRRVWHKILKGGSSWKEHDPFDVTPRLGAKQDLYNTPNQCTVFRPWQGWTALSSTSAGEGTLRLLPMLPLSTAYIILRPFFKPKHPSSTSLKCDDWEVDLDSSYFPGCQISKTIELNLITHPHLRLDQTMISIPKVEPGDQVYWHCDVVHSVESEHKGVGDSSVLYIPGVPLTPHNAEYLRDQRTNFLAGLPAPDFPGGEGESILTGRATMEDINNHEARRVFGFEQFRIPYNSTFEKKVNDIIVF